MADETLDYTIPVQLTKTIRRDPYDAISPTNPELSAAGKVIIITGGGTGLGAVRLLTNPPNDCSICLTGRSPLVCRLQPKFGQEPAL